jgi:hypothetical protein
MVENVPPNSTVNQKFYVQVAIKLQETVGKKKTLFVELWLACAPRQWIGAHSDFGPPVFS